MPTRTPLMIVSALLVIMGALGSAIPASAAPATTQATDAVVREVRYTIVVRTSDTDDAGTDATIRMKVYGTLRDSPGYVNLDNDADNFERGKTDTFGPFFWFDIGRPDFIGVYKGSNGSEWAPQYATIIPKGGPSYDCPMSEYYGDGEETRWFDCP